MENSRQGVLWTSSNSERKATGIFQALSAGAVTLVNLPLHTEHLQPLRDNSQGSQELRAPGSRGFLSLDSVIPQWGRGPLESRGS